MRLKFREKKFSRKEKLTGNARRNPGVFLIHFRNPIPGPKTNIIISREDLEMNDMKKQITRNNILEFSCLELIRYFRANIKIVLPEKIETADEMTEAQKMMAKYTQWFVFLGELKLSAKLKTTTEKNKGVPKEITAENMFREEILERYSELLKRAYDTISRMITVRMEINSELKMMNGMI